MAWRLRYCKVKPRAKVAEGPRSKYVELPGTGTA